MGSIPNGPGEEKRKDKRVSLLQEIECIGVEGRFRKRLADISVGGMFIDSLTAFPSGEVITLSFRLPHSDEPIEVTAKVVYVQERIGTGVQFLDLKSEDREKIQEFVDRLSSKKRSLGGELGTASRVLVNIPVTLTGTDTLGASFEGKATILTLARNGASIRTDRELDLNMIIFLRMPNGAQFEARVVWVGAEEVGIQSRGLAQALGFNFP